MVKRIGVLLSGCGVYDGAEIHEAVLTLLALDRAGVEYECLAPDAPQHHVVDHVTGEPTEEIRNILVESARIARGEITPLAKADLGNLSALVIPGGFGAAKNLCDYAINGADCKVRDDVADAISTMRKAGKPIGAICIAPVILAKVLGHENVSVTIGSDPGTAEHINGFGAKHVECTAEECHVDKERKVVTTPAYMRAGSIAEAAIGIEKLVEALIALI